MQEFVCIVPAMAVDLTGLHVLLVGLLEFDPEKRVTASSALDFAFVKEGEQILLNQFISP